jgi:hypothetical protein
MSYCSVQMMNGLSTLKATVRIAPLNGDSIRWTAAGSHSMLTKRLR